MGGSRVRGRLREAAGNAFGFGLDSATKYARLRCKRTGRAAAMVRGAEAVLVPTAAAGFTVLWAWTDAYGSPVPALPGGGLVATAAVFAAFLYCLASTAENLGTWHPSRRAKILGAAAVLSLLATVTAVGCVFWSVQSHARDERGIEVTCTVIAIAEDSRPVGDGGTGSETYYVHRIACPPGGPSSVTSGVREAEPGKRLRVVYDPEHRLRTTTETSPVDWHLTAVVAAIALAVSLALNITCVAVRVRT